MSRTTKLLSGFSLVETLIALMLVAVFGAAVVYILAQVVSVTNSADQKSQATFYANQGIEAVRDYYQKNLWLSLAGKDPSAHPTCYKDLALSVSATCRTTLDLSNVTPYEGIGSPAVLFYRQISINKVSSSKVLVTTYVFWVEKGKSNVSRIDAVFYNY